MSELFLDSLQISGFRAFRKLAISRLGLVNLVVGKNNVGKTSLLEALYLYARGGALNALWDVIEWRGDGKRDAASERREQTYASLFYDRQPLAFYPEPIRIGPVSPSKEPLMISVAQDESIVPSDNADRSLPVVGLWVSPTGIVDRFGRPINATRPLTATPHACHFVLSHGIGDEEIGRLWDAITLTDREDDVLRALQFLAPEVERLNFRVDGQRTAYVRLRGAAQPVRLRSMGEGMNRVLGLVLALANAAGGVLLIDEFENGLHYSVQPAIWRLIFEVAQRLNVQVFATTHSSDCLTAFQHVACERPEEGLLIRLGRKDDGIAATLFDEEELAVAVEQNIEVR